MKLSTSAVLGFVSSMILHGAHAFTTPTPYSASSLKARTTSNSKAKVSTSLIGTSARTSTSLYAKEKGTIQILMSDTGGGHRASANALRDAFDELYPGQIEVDIVDIFTDYGPFYPINAFVPIYKIMAEYPILWEITYKSGATPVGLWFNELVLEVRLCIFI